MPNSMKTSKEHFKYLFKYTDHAGSYKNITETLDGIFALEGEARTTAFKAYYTELFKIIYKSGIDYRLRTINDPSIIKRNSNPTLIASHVIREDLKNALESYAKEKELDDEIIMKGLSTSTLENKNVTYDICKEYNHLGILETNGKTQHINLLNETLTVTSRRFSNPSDNYVFTNDFSKSKNKEIAELYVLHKEREAVYAEKSGWWKFFHPIQNARTKSFLKNVDSLLTKVGFNKETNGPEAMEHFSKTQPSFLSTHMEYEDSAYEKTIKEAQEMERRKNIKQITAARDKYKNAELLNKDPKTSFRGKIDHLIKKYNLNDPKVINEFSIDPEDYGKNAEPFDTLRDLSGVKSSIYTRYMSVYRLMILSSLEKTGTVNPKEILQDAHEFISTELKHFTVIYEHPDAKDFLRDSSFGGVSVNVLKNKMVGPIKVFRNKQGNPMTEEEINRLKNEVEEIVTEHRNNRETYIQKELGNSVNPIMEAEERVPMSVNINDQPNVEQISQPVISSFNIETSMEKNPQV